MEPWEQALDKISVDWKKRKEVVGILVCGSYVTGDPSEHSDIDLHLVLSDKVDWRERGNRIVDGYLIEYFANPVKQIRKYFEGDFKNNDRMAATQFVTGRILYDKTGEMKRLKREAHSWQMKEFKQMSREDIEKYKYGLWDGYDNLKEAYDNGSPSFVFTYHHYLYSLLWIYSKLVKHDIFHKHNTFELLSDEWMQRKYLQKEFPDHKFVGTFVAAMDENNKEWMIRHAEHLKNYVLEKMGGFNIDGWKIRSPLEDDGKKTKNGKTNKSAKSNKKNKNKIKKRNQNKKK